jgi:hypothetical protein
MTMKIFQQNILHRFHSSDPNKNIRDGTGTALISFMHTFHTFHNLLAVRMRPMFNFETDKHTFVRTF